jgi:hypothetical protein
MLNGKRKRYRMNQYDIIIGGVLFLGQSYYGYYGANDIMIDGQTFYRNFPAFLRPLKHLKPGWHSGTLMQAMA